MYNAHQILVRDNAVTEVVELSISEYLSQLTMDNWSHIPKLGRHEIVGNLSKSRQNHERFRAIAKLNTEFQAIYDSYESSLRTGSEFDVKRFDLSAVVCYPQPIQKGEAYLLHRENGGCKVWDQTKHSEGCFAVRCCDQSSSRVVALSHKHETALSIGILCSHSTCGFRSVIIESAAIYESLDDFLKS